MHQSFRCVGDVLYTSYFYMWLAWLYWRCRAFAQCISRKYFAAREKWREFCYFTSVMEHRYILSTFMMFLAPSIAKQISNWFHVILNDIWLMRSCLMLLISNVVDLLVRWMECTILLGHISDIFIFHLYASPSVLSHNFRNWKRLSDNVLRLLFKVP